LGYPIPRSVKIARTLFTKKEAYVAERLLISAAEKREVENEAFSAAWNAIEADPSILDRIRRIDNLAGDKRRHARSKFNSRYAKVADWSSFCRAADKWLEIQAQKASFNLLIPLLTAAE